MRILIASAAIALGTTAAFAASHSPAPMVEAMDQAIANGMVTAAKVVAGEPGWLVVHRTGMDMKPGPVIGRAPLEMGENMDVSAELSEDVAAGDMLMLMVHSETGGMMEGEFEYTLGAKEDGPVFMDGKLVTATITVK